MSYFGFYGVSHYVVLHESKLIQRTSVECFLLLDYVTALSLWDLVRVKVSVN